MLCTCYYFVQVITCKKLFVHVITCTKFSQKKMITCTKASILLYSFLLDTSDIFSVLLLYPPATQLQGGILVSPCPSVCPSIRPSVCLQTNPMLYDNLSCVSQNLLKFYQQLTGEERRIPFIFDDFHFCRSRVIGLDMTENRIFTLCRMIT